LTEEDVVTFSHFSGLREFDGNIVA